MKTLLSSFQSTFLTPSCALVETSRGGILVGCISEAVKYMDRAGLSYQPLRAIVLSDTTQVQGISNWAFEFPIYKSLFVDRSLDEGRKLSVIGSKKQLRRARAVMSVTLMGPSKQLYKRWSRMYPGTSGRFQMLYKASRTFLSEKADGTSMELDDLVEFIPYTQMRRVDLGDLSVEHVGKDWFRISDVERGELEDVRLSFDQIPEPPFSLDALKQRDLQKPEFGLSVLSNGNGFDARSGCTSFVIWIEGAPYLWDAGPFTTQCLHAHGLTVKDLAGVIITHVHDDHASIVELLSMGERIRLFATVEVYESLLIKYAAVLDRDLEDPQERRELEQFMDFVAVEPGVEMRLGAARFTAHHTLHSIPTIGGKFEMGVGVDPVTLLITGDHASARRVREVSMTGGLPGSWLNHLETMVQGDEDLVIYDGGADSAGIHGDPMEPELRNLSAAMGERLQFGHRCGAVLPDGREIPVAGMGSEFVLIEGETVREDYSALVSAFGMFGFVDEVALDRLWGEAEVVDFQADKVICEQGAQADYACIVSGGQIVVEGLEVTNPIILTRGCICGEMAALTGAPRNASLHTLSASRLIRISVEVFQRFVIENSLLERFEKLWAHRDVVIQVKGFRELPLEIIHIVTRNLQRIDLDRGEAVIKQGDATDEAYMIASGTLKVDRDGHVVATLRAGDLFGEKAALTEGRSPRTATIRAHTPCTLLRFEGGVIRELNRRYFVVNHILRLLLRERNLLKD